MENSIIKQAANFLRRQRNNRRWQATVLCLALIVVLGTVLILKLPGQAQTHQEKVLNCQLEVHEHTKKCYDKEKNLICGYADYVVHTHNSDCYDSNGKLVCELPEIKEHKHTSDCYEEQKVLTCTLEESKGHQHTDSCYTEEKGSLSCSLDAHQHSDSCYDEDGSLVCGKEEHKHTDACYEWNKVLTCGMTEGEGSHSHSNSCYSKEKVLTCGEIELHTHSKECYDKDDNLTCDLLELVEHVHSDKEGCFETVELTDEEVAGLNETTEATEDTAEEETSEASTDLTQIFFGTEETEETDETDIVDETDIAETEEVLEETELTEEEIAEGIMAQTVKTNDYIITVKYTEEAGLPENAELRATLYDKDSEIYQQRCAEAGIEFEWLFDIGFYVDDEKVEPLTEVTVSIKLAGSEATEYKITHFTDDSIDQLDSQSTGNQVEFTTDGFSDFGLLTGGKVLKEVEGTFGVSTTAATSSVTGSGTENDPYVIEVGVTGTITGTESAASAWTIQTGYGPGTSPKTYSETWTSEKTDTATVVEYSGNSATVKGVGTGTVKITHQYCTSQTDRRGNTTYTTQLEYITVQVIDSGTKYSATATASTVKAGEKLEFSQTPIIFTYKAEDGTETSETFEKLSGFDWSSSDDTVAKVDSTGTVTGVKGGTATIYAKWTDDTSDDKKIYELTWEVTVPTTVTYLVSADWSDTTRTISDLGVSPVGWFYGDDTTTGTVKTIDQADEQYVIGVEGLAPVTITKSGFECVDQVGDDGTYILKSPTSTTRVAYGDNGNVLAAFTFSGWLVNGVLKNPGDQITVSGNMTVTAKWYATKTQSAQFYLNIQSSTNGMTLSGSNWTGALYTSSVETNLTYLDSEDRNLFYGVGNDDGQATIANMSKADAYVRANATKAIYTSNSQRDSSEYMKVTSAFPTDAEIFARLNSWGSRKGEQTIEVNGEQVNVTDINTKNYVIYWARVFANTDSWHFDGIIIPKTGKLVVTKTFVGDKTVIDQVKKNYFITVKQGNDTAYTLYPVEKDSISADKGIGYTSYDEDTQTYTWELDVTQLKDYTVQENNYVASGDYVTSATYQISGAEETGYNTEGWQTYTTGTDKFRCYSVYDDNDPKTTVSLRNVYVKKWTMSVFKTDKTTSHALAGVEFELEVKDANGNVVEVSDESGNIIDSTGDQNTTKRVITDANGNIDIVFPETPGTYTFTLTEIFASEDTSEEESEELVTTGYKTIGDITGTAYIQSDGYVKVQILSVANPPDGKTVTVDDSGAIINVVNHSETASMTVNKVWTDNTNKPVTMQLLRNGSPISDKILVLTESTGWTGTWNDLPIYVDGMKAEYSVREIQIGEDNESDTRKYTPQDDASDGYADYIVVTQPTVATEDDEGNVRYTVTVQNTKDNGQVVFTKVDENGKALSGATFTVYTDESCKTVAKIKDGDAEKDAKFTSDLNGIVKIEGLTTTGVHYVKETEAPSGYALDETVYKLDAENYNSTITTLDGKTVTKVVNKKAEVTLQLVKRDNGATDGPNLVGATFNLYNASAYDSSTKTIKASATAIVSDITSKSDPVTITKLKQGTYYLLETKAPDGYNLLEKAILINVNADGTITLPEGISSFAEVEPTKVDNTEVPYSYTITVYNSTGQELPHTGGIGTSIYTIGGLAILALGCLYGFSMRRKRERRYE
jgi:LPXTG-motif cell wall-anchored protein